MKRITARHDLKVCPGAFVTCVYNPDRALCRARHGEASGPERADCQPLACRNTALTADDRAALTAHAAELDTALSHGDLLAPYVRHRLTEQHQQTIAFLSRHYGYVGRAAGFDADTLVKGASLGESLITGDDDQGDQITMRVGIELYDKYGDDMTEDQLRQGINDAMDEMEQAQRNGENVPQIRNRK
nr:polymorphic toxin type 44 domain-containing protein [Streptomyces sp. NBC_00974]